MECTPPPPLGQEDTRRYLVGSLPATTGLSQACPYAKAMLAYSSVTGTDVILSLTCKRWGCRKCGPRKARRMAYRVEEAQPNKFITLTVRPEHMETPRHCYDRSRRQLAELAKVLRAKLGEFEYLRILEVHKSGFPHYHLMARCPYIPQAQLSGEWSKLMNSPIVDVRKVQKHDNVFRYMIKYLCKQSYIPWTDRRVSWSRKFMAPAPEFEGINLELMNLKRTKETPAAYAEKIFPGREIYEITPTCHAVLPEEGKESYHFFKWTGQLGEPENEDHDANDTEFT